MYNENYNLKTNHYDHVIFTLFACWLVVDMLNGYLLRTGFPLSVSQLYKSIVTVLVIARCYDVEPVLRLVCCITIYLSIYLLNILFIGEDVVSSLTLISKLLSSLIFYYYFIQVNNTDRYFFLQKARFILTISFVVFTVNMFLGMLGVGFKSYENGSEGIGSRGFFYALNELSGVLAVLFPWVFYYCKKKMSFVNFYVCSALLFVLSFTLSSKSGIIATIIFFILTNYFYGGKYYKIAMVVLLVVILFLGFSYYQLFLSANLPVIERFNYFVEKNGFIDALTSNRLNFWEDRSKEFFKSGLSAWIIGLGGNRTVEMDPFDALLNCGLVGFVFLLFLYFKLLFSPLFKKYKSLPYSKVVFCSNLMLIIISIGGGHILFSSMAGMLIALSNAMLFGKRSITNSRELLKYILLKEIIIKR